MFLILFSDYCFPAIGILKAGFPLFLTQNLTRNVLILGGMWSAAEEERGRLEHGALRRLSTKGGRRWGSYTKAEEGQTVQIITGSGMM